ncbi:MULTISPECIES: hypothetical protein [unclassified Streptomyces]|uniref:hypothetical protein n=1 Tax=Streptomyces sp. NPDC056835 TaxID=3345956 RepID=UPI0036BF1855
MAQHAAEEIESFRTNDGDRVFRCDVNGAFLVAFIYADQSPQFIACDTPEEAEVMFTAARQQADQRGNLREVESYESDHTAL